MGGDGENVEMIVDDDTIRTVGKREKKTWRNEVGTNWSVFMVGTKWKTRLSLKRPTTS